MRKEMRGILFFLFILMLLATAGISEADFEGTVGTRFTITDAGFGTKKPQVYVEYEKKPGVVKKVYAKVEEWSDTAVTCLWKKSLPPGSYLLWVNPHVKGAAPLSEGTFTIKTPVIDAVTPHTLSAGSTILMNGQFFTDKKPGVYLKDPVSLKRKHCRVLHSTMDPMTGASSLNFVVPKGESDDYEIILRTLVGETPVAIPNPEQLALSVTPASLPSGIMNTSYNQTVGMSASGGEPPYTYSCAVSGGSDLSASVSPAETTAGSADCTISGTPPVSGSYTIDFQITDSASNSASATPITISVSASSAHLPDTWHMRNSLPDGDAGDSLRGVAYGNGTFVAVGYSDTLTSSDGITWTPRPFGPFSVTYGNSIFAGVAGNIIYTSPDGISWEAIEATTTASPHTILSLKGVNYCDGIFLSVGDAEMIGSLGTICTSGDSTTWSCNVGFGIYADLRGAACGNDIFVAAGNLVLTSPNATVWAPNVPATERAINGVTFGNATFIAVGDNGVILTSSDGIDWTPRNSETQVALNGVAYGNGAFVAVGDNGVVLTSSNGIDWTLGNSGTQVALNGVNYGNGTFVVVGDLQTILQSNPLSE